MARFIVLASLCLPAICLAQVPPPPPVPHGCPPVVVMAKAISSQGKVELFLDVPVNRAVEERAKVIVDGQVVEQIRIVYQSVMVQQAHIVDGKKVSVTDKNGKNIAADDLPTLLEKKTAVVMFRGKLDPYYLQVLRDSVLIVRLPDNAPAQDFKKQEFPKEKLPPPEKRMP